MRILFAGSRPGYPQRMTGAAVSTYLLAGMLSQTGAAVHHLCGNAADGGILPAGESVADFGGAFTVERVTDPAAALPVSVRLFRPDVIVLSAGALPGLRAAVAGIGLPVVVYQRDVGFAPVLALHKAGVLAGVFACSGFVAEALNRQTGLTAGVLPNIFPPARYRVPAPGDLITLINPVPAKGVDLALDLAARHPELPFLFVEGWKMPPRLKAAVLRRAAAAGNVRWQRPVADMRRVYARTRLLLVPSQWREAWGRVVTEAQISGIPVLASDRGGLPEAVGAGGMVLPCGDVDTWSDALSRTMSDAVLWSRLSDAAITHARRDVLNPNRILSEFICQMQDWLRQFADSRAARPLALMSVKTGSRPI